MAELCLMTCDDSPFNMPHEHSTGFSHHCYHNRAYFGCTFQPADFILFMFWTGLWMFVQKSVYKLH